MSESISGARRRWWSRSADGPVTALRLEMSTTIGVGLLVLGLGVVMSGDAFMLNILTTGAVLYPLVMSFNLLLGYAGLPSFAHPVYFGLGAYASGYAAAQWGWGFLSAMLVGAVLSGVVAALTALPTMKQRSHFLAIATLALLITANELYLQLDGITGGVNGFIGIPSAAIGPWVFDPGTLSFLVLALALAVVVQLLQDRMLASRFGRTLAVLRTTPHAGQSVGMNLFRARLTVFVLTGAIAGISGAMFARQNLFISPADFGLDRAVDLLFVLVLGGMGTRIGPLIGLIALLALRELSNSFVDYRLVIFGVLIIAVLCIGKEGVGGAMMRLVRRLPRRSRSSAVPAMPSDAEKVIEVERDSDRTLRLDGIDHYFSGVHSVNQVSLELPAGTVMGVIGPNGAGKTTLLNIITGIIRPAGGSITFGKNSLVGRTPEQIARLGVVRTFQHAQMIPEMLLVENVMVGFERFAKASLIEQLLHVGRSPREERHFREIAGHLLAAVGVQAGLERAEEVSYGVQRRAEIARCLAAQPDIMLLDEPGAGLNDAERDLLLPILDRLRSLGVGILLIDHNVGFVSQACSTAVVLVNGAIIRSGSPAEVLRDPEVLRAYIGSSGIDRVEGASS